jgi:hypothetical protein
MRSDVSETEAAQRRHTLSSLKRTPTSAEQMRRLDDAIRGRDPALCTASISLCDSKGNVDLDDLSERARCNCFCARTVGSEFFFPVVQDATCIQSPVPSSATSNSPATTFIHFNW